MIDGDDEQRARDEMLIPTPTDLVHDLNRAKVELRAELRDLRSDLRVEFREAMEAQATLLTTASIGRHEKVLIRVDSLEDARVAIVLAIKETHMAFRVEADRRFSDMDLRYQQRFDAQQKALSDSSDAGKEMVNAALASADRAVTKAEVSAERRFESVNEFRATLADQAATFLPRSEADARFGAVGDKVGLLDGMTPRAEHNQLAASLSKLEIELRGNLGSLVRRDDLSPMNVAIEKLRDQAAATAGNSEGNQRAVDDRRAAVGTNAVVMTCVGGFLLIFVTIVIAAFSIHSASAPDANARRLDDLLAYVNQQTLAYNARMDALSARLNMAPAGAPLAALVPGPTGTQTTPIPPR